MTRVVRFRRGNNDQHSTFIGAESEISVNTDKDCIVVHDGVTEGGFEHVNVSSNQRIINKDIVATGLSVTGISTLDVTVTSSIEVENNLTTNNMNADTSSIKKLNVGSISIDPGSDLFVSGTTVVSESISIGSSTPVPEKTRLFVSNDSGEAEFIIPGTYTWIAPDGVSSVSVVCVGGGAGGGQSTSFSSGASPGGGGLAWKNNIPVVPGQSYTVVVGAGGSSKFGGNGFAGENSYFISTSTVIAYGAPAPGPGATPGLGGTYFGDGGGNGGSGGFKSGNSYAAGSGGAGGYVGTGGTGGNTSPSSGSSGSGGAGGGGGGGQTGGAGGGVGIYGQGNSGSGGALSSTGSAGSGRGGSGGSTAALNAKVGGLYGGGGKSTVLTSSIIASAGGGGAVRIVWGEDKAFPSSNVAKSSPTDVLVYTTTGSVGVGTTNPSTKMEVLGDVKVGLNTSQGIILTASNGSKYRLIVNTNGTLTTTFVP